MRSRVNIMARSAAQESMIIELNDPLTLAKAIILIFPAQKIIWRISKLLANGGKI